MKRGTISYGDTGSGSQTTGRKGVYSLFGKWWIHNRDRY